MGGWFGVYAFGNNAEGLEVKPSYYKNHMIITKTFGSFQIEAEVEFNGLQSLEAVGYELASLGALYLFERSVSSNAEAKVFGELLEWEKNKTGGRKRPAGFNRSSVPYDGVVSENLRLAFTTSVELPSGQRVRFHKISVCENVPNSPADTKELLDLVKEFYALEAEKQAIVASKFGITTMDRESITEGCRLFLKAKKEELKKQVKNAFA